jgi:hypothetical protein
MAVLCNGRKQTLLALENADNLVMHGPKQAPQKQKSPVTRLGFLLEFLGWLMGLEPTTTGITILDSTN